MHNYIVFFAVFFSLLTRAASPEEAYPVYEGALWEDDNPWDTQAAEVSESPERISNDEDGEEYPEEYPVDNYTFINNKRSKTRGFDFDTTCFSEIFYAINEFENISLETLLTKLPKTLLEVEPNYGFSPLTFAIAINNHEAVEVLLRHKVKISPDDLNFALTKHPYICALLINSAQSKSEKWSFYNEKNSQQTTLAHQIIIHPSDSAMTQFLELSLVDDKTVINPMIETASKCNLFMFMHERSCFARFEEVLDFFIKHSVEPLSDELFISHNHGSIIQAAISRIRSKPGDYAFCPSNPVVVRLLEYRPWLVNYICEKSPHTPLDMLNKKYDCSIRYPDNLQNDILTLIDVVINHGGMTTEDFISYCKLQHIKSAASQGY